MHTGTNYKLSEFLLWTRRDIYILAGLSTIPTVLYGVFGLHWITLAWVLIALIGTAAAFIIGFKNTQTYNRLWEARQIWGAIVNGSRSWGIMSRDMIDAGPVVKRELIYRHCAWLTALRYQLRKPQAWETQNKSYNKEYHSHFSVPEWDGKLEDELKRYLSDSELSYILSKKNRATQLISLQSKQLKTLRDAGAIAPNEYVALEKQLSDFYDFQGRAERIKNFPYPRQFSSITLFFVWLFVIILPFGLVGEFNKLGSWTVWLNIPFSTILAWVFTSMDKVGEATENPFEGSANDIPMAALSRTIEIDLRDMLDEDHLPEPLTPVNKILM